MSQPNYSLLGTAPDITGLLIGCRDAAVRKVGTVANDGGTAVTYRRGEVLYLADDGYYRPLTAAMLTPAVTVTAVTGEAVGSGTGSLTAFSLVHTPVVPSSLSLTVAGEAVTTGWTLDANTGRIVFTAAPASGAAIVAGYSYFDGYAEAAADKALVVDRVLAVLEEAAAVAAKSGDTPGTTPIQLILKGEVAQDLLYLESTAYGSLSAANARKLSSALTASGIVPGAVVR